MFHKKTILYILFSVITLATLSPANAVVDCNAQPWDVGNPNDFNDAIACFNAKPAGDYTINLTGAINLTASTTTIENTTANTKLTINGAGFKIDGNDTGGVRPITIAENTTVTIDHTTITNGNNNVGGGILNLGTLTLSNSTVSGNMASQHGGGIANGGQLTLTNSTVSGNTASNNGGGIANAGTLMLTNSTISGNTATNIGGGILNTGALTLTNSTVSGNAATNIGGGIFNAGTLTLINSIIANNTQSNDELSDCINDGGTITATHNNLIESMGFNACDITADNGNIIGQDPKLEPLANNGGATQTHALLPNSPAIYAGTAGPNIPSTDQRGFARDAIPDIGAFEAFIGCTDTTSAGEWTVNDEASLIGAILCFNNKTAATHTINLTSNVLLNASTLPINNDKSGVELTINGDGFEIDGQILNSVRPITVAANTTVTIDNATITGGKTVTNGSTDDQSGGGIFNQGTLTLTNSTVSGNMATTLGGGIYNKGTLTLTNSTVSGNEARRGGGIDNINGTLNLTNSTISGNKSTTFDAGGVFNLNGHLTLINSTVYGNTARDTGAAGAGVDSYGNMAELTLTNTIIANNTSGGASSDCQNRVGSMLNTSNNNLIQNAASACGLSNGSNGNIIGVTDTVLKLGDLANNGGATKTHALLVGSPAIGAGTAGQNIPTTDQRGFARDNNPDIGAFEAFDGCNNASNSWEVADEISLANAILCFNNETNAATHTITLIADVNLSGSTPTITNTGAELTINGDGFNIDGQNKIGVRPITVATDTTVTIDNITITGGKTVTSGTFDEQSGGGIYNKGTLTLTNSTVSGNTASFNGGGIFNFNGQLTLTNSTVSGNTASFNGGGIYNYLNSTLTLTNSTVSGNTAYNGGGIYNFKGTLTLTNSTVSGNTAYNGGGIFNYFGTLTLTNSTVSGNTSNNGSGGGIFNFDATLTLTNSTISGNTATTGDGGGVYNANGGINGGTLTLINSIIANNTQSDDELSDCINNGGTITAAHNNLIQNAGNACGLNNGDNGNIIGVDPMLEPLADNGGATFTHALQPGSLAIDAGTTGPNIPTTDQRGYGRDSMPDIGAFEYEAIRPDLIFKNGFENP